MPGPHLDTPQEDVPGPGWLGSAATRASARQAPFRGHRRHRGRGCQPTWRGRPSDCGAAFAGRCNRRDHDRRRRPAPCCCRQRQRHAPDAYRGDDHRGDRRLGFPARGLADPKTGLRSARAMRPAHDVQSGERASHQERLAGARRQPAAPATGPVSKAVAIVALGGGEPVERQSAIGSHWSRRRRRPARFGALEAMHSCGLFGLELGRESRGSRRLAMARRARSAGAYKPGRKNRASFRPQSKRGLDLTGTEGGETLRASRRQSGLDSSWRRPASEPPRPHRSSSMLTPSSQQLTGRLAVRP